MTLLANKTFKFLQGLKEMVSYRSDVIWADAMLLIVAAPNNQDFHCG
jgi:hypothetical protein